MRVEKKAKTAVIFMILLILAVSCLCGCSGKLEMFREEEEKYEVINSTDVFLPMAYVRTLNPALSKDEDTYYISKLIYEGLFELDDTMKAVPKLVRSYKYNDEGTQLTLTLRDDIFWHDGEKLTGDDVKFTVDLLTNLSAENSTLYGKYVDNIKSVQTNKSDKQKVTILFKEASDSSAEKLTFPILPKHQYKSIAEVKKHIDDFEPIGTGPYKVSKYDSLKSLALVPNENYYGTVPGNKLTFKVVPSNKEALSLMGANDISLLFIKDIDRETIINNAEVKTQNFPSNCVEFIGFNFNKEYLRNKRIRQAIAYAADSEKILESAYYSCGILVDSMYYPGYLGIANEGDVYPYDPEKAEKLLKEIGINDSDGDGYLDDESGKALNIEILISEGDVSRSAAAQIIKHSLDELHISSQIVQCTQSEYLTRINSGDYDIFIGEYSFADYYDLRPLLHSAYGNIINYSNSTIDYYLDIMGNGASDDKVKAYEDLKKLLQEELPYYPVLYRTYGMVMSESLEGESTPIFSDLYRGAENWKLTYKRLIETENNDIDK